MAPRAFILGNGPSLASVDLALLTGGVTFACNRIHLHPSWELGWRPDYYLAVDASFNPDFAKDLRYHLSGGYPVISSTEFAYEAMLPAPDGWRADDLAHIREWWTYSQLRCIPRCFHDAHRLPVAWHPPLHCALGGPVHMAIQVAVLEMGCNDLQLYGCDGDITTDPTRNNFSSDYLRVSALPQWYVDAKNTALNTAQAIMLVECEGRGVKVTNVSL